MVYIKIDLEIEKVNIYEDIFNFLCKYKKLLKVNIDINNFKKI